MSRCLGRGKGREVGWGVCGVKYKPSRLWRVRKMKLKALKCSNPYLLKKIVSPEKCLPFIQPIYEDFNKIVRLNEQIIDVLRTPILMVNPKTLLFGNPKNEDL